MFVVPVLKLGLYNSVKCPGLDSGVNGLEGCYCDTLPAGQHLSHDIQTIKIND
jgi:hypothetical protein